MAFANLLDTDYLFKRSMVDSNVDTKLLTTFITTAQDLHIQSILGENLYNKIMNDVASTGTTTGGYLILLQNYIMPAHMWWTIYEALPFISFKITNKSVTQKASPNDPIANSTDLNWLRNITRNNAEFYTQRIREYIVNDPSSFPEYYTSIGIERIVPKRTTYFSGIYLPRVTKKVRKTPGYSDPSCDDCGDGGNISGIPLN